MADDVLLNKAAMLERCVARARETYAADPATFATDLIRQDAAILNIQRACAAATDMGQHLIRREGLGIPQSAHDTLDLLSQTGWLDPGLAEGLKRMVGFNNIMVHDYDSLHLPITIRVLERDLDILLHFRQAMLKHGGEG